MIRDNIIEQRYLKKLEDEKSFMKNYDETINKVDSIVKTIIIIICYNKLQEEVQVAKQMCMHLNNYLITELSKQKKYCKRLWYMVNNVKIYVYVFREIKGDP